MATQGTDMSGKVCIVTGANSGIGLETAAGIAERGATVVMACRSRERAEAAQKEIESRGYAGATDVMLVDMASFDSIRAFADAFKQKYDRLDVLVNNAAIVPKSRELTQDGIEKQFGVNHLAYFLLTHLLLDQLKESAPSRIVNVASTVHQSATINFEDLQAENGYSFIKAYGQSKLANVMFTYELARRLEGTDVTANCLHPGGVSTNIFRDASLFLKPILFVGRAFLKGPKRGAKTSVYLATSPEVEGVTGKYFVNCKEAKSSALSHDRDAQQRLWDISARLTRIET